MKKLLKICDFFIKRFNLILLVILLVGYGFYIFAYQILHWYSPDAKWIYYIVTGTVLLCLVAEEIVGYRDLYQKQFNIICKLTIAVNFVLFALISQDYLKNDILCLFILYGSVFAISMGVIYNLKTYDYI